MYWKGSSEKGLPRRLTVVNRFLQQYYLDYPCHGSMNGYSEAWFSGILSLHGNTWTVLKAHGKEQRHLAFAFLFCRNGHLKCFGSWFWILLGHSRNWRMAGWVYSSHLLFSAADSRNCQKTEKKNQKLLSWRTKPEQIKYDKNAVYRFVTILKVEKLKQKGEMTCLRSETINLMTVLRKEARLSIL